MRGGSPHDAGQDGLKRSCVFELGPALQLVRMPFLAHALPPSLQLLIICHLRSARQQAQPRSTVSQHYQLASIARGCMMSCTQNLCCFKSAGSSSSPSISGTAGCPPACWHLHRHSTAARNGPPSALWHPRLEHHPPQRSSRVVSPLPRRPQPSPRRPCSVRLCETARWKVARLLLRGRQADRKRVASSTAALVQLSHRLRRSAGRACSSKRHCRPYSMETSSMENDPGVNAVSMVPPMLIRFSRASALGRMVHRKCGSSNLKTCKGGQGVVRGLSVL